MTLDVTQLTGHLSLNTTQLSGFLKGLQLYPPSESVTLETFQLTTFFAAISSLFENERIPQISLIGGCNGTHTVRLLADPSTPHPSTSLNHTQNHALMMSWTNCTVTDLRDLAFHVIEGVHYTDVILNPTLISPQSPYLVDAQTGLNTRLLITALSDPLALTLTTRNSPPEASGAFQLLGVPIQITTTTNPETLTYTLQMTYTDQQVAAAGIDESTLMIQYWDPATETWITVPASTVNTDANRIEATLTHFSVFALVGTTAPLWTQPWFLSALTILGISSVSVVVTLWRRRSN